MFFIFICINIKAKQIEHAFMTQTILFSHTYFLLP